MRKSLQLAFLAILALPLISSCGPKCKQVTPERLAQASDALHLLQGSYDTSVGFAKGQLNPSAQDAATLEAIQAGAKLAVPLVDAALKMLGETLAQECQADPDLALATAKAAQEAQAKILAQAQAAKVDQPVPTPPAPAAPQAD